MRVCLHLSRGPVDLICTGGLVYRPGESKFDPRRYLFATRRIHGFSVLTRPTQYQSSAVVEGQVAFDIERRPNIPLFDRRIAREMPQPCFGDRYERCSLLLRGYKRGREWGYGESLFFSVLASLIVGPLHYLTKFVSLILNPNELVYCRLDVFLLRRNIHTLRD